MQNKKIKSAIYKVILVVFLWTVSIIGTWHLARMYTSMELGFLYASVLEKAHQTRTGNRNVDMPVTVAFNGNLFQAKRTKDGGFPGGILYWCLLNTADDIEGERIRELDERYISGLKLKPLPEKVDGNSWMYEN